MTKNSKATAEGFAVASQSTSVDSHYNEYSHEAQHLYEPRHNSDFKSAMMVAGIDPPSDLIADGNIQRFHIDGDRRGSKNGWYVIYDNETFQSGAYGCWKRDISENWCSKNLTDLSASEKSAFKTNKEESKKQRAEEHSKLHAKCRDEVADIWANAQPAPPTHSYLLKKKVQPHDLKVLNGNLIVPVASSDRVHHGIQYIDPRGNKWFHEGTAKKGHYCLIGGVPDRTIHLVEGYATGATIYEVMKRPVAVCFDAGNLKPVAEAVRKKYPSLQIVICADNDRQRNDNPGVLKAKDASISSHAIVIVPEFPENDDGTDFNDLFITSGAEEVRRQIESAEQKNPHQPCIVSIEQFLQTEFPPREMILSPWLPCQGLTMVFAPRGVGKTHFSLGVAYAVASGGTFIGWEAEKPRGVLFIDGEMPAVVLQERLSKIIVSNEKEPSAPLHIITPDLQKASMMNLSEPHDQTLIDANLDDIELIIVDNLSTLCRSGNESESESWLPVQDWALRQRSAGRSVLFIHHSGKSGDQRGTSRREDVLDTVISLKRPGGYTPDQGACFEVHFEKARGLYGDESKPFEAKLTTDESGGQTWLTKPLEQSTAEKVAELLNDGVEQKDIPEFLGLSKGAVSKAKKKAEELGLIHKRK